MIIRNDRKKNCPTMVYFECVAELRHSGAFVALLRNSVLVWPQRLDNFLSLNFHLLIQTIVQLWTLIKNGLYLVFISLTKTLKLADKKLVQF